MQLSTNARSVTALTHFRMACALCKKRNELKESHILSKFFYKPLKTIDGKIYVLTDDPSHKNLIVQDGIKEYLLCGACESKRSKWETYFSNKWHRGELFGKTDSYEIEGLDYSNFKLFLMSLLFMASISNDPLFADVKLTPTRFERLRQMVDAMDPGEVDEYGCSIRLLEDDHVDPKMLIGKAETINVTGVPVHRFLFGGFSLAFIDSEGINIGVDVRQTYITKEGTIRIRKKQLRDLDYMIITLRNLKEQRKLDEEDA
jgi:hypothetical protein